MRVHDEITPTSGILLGFNVLPRIPWKWHNPCSRNMTFLPSETPTPLLTLTPNLFTPNSGPCRVHALWKINGSTLGSKSQLTWGLAHDQCSVDIFWMNEQWMDRQMGIGPSALSLSLASSRIGILSVSFTACSLWTHSLKPSPQPPAPIQLVSVLLWLLSSINTFLEQHSWQPWLVKSPHFTGPHGIMDPLFPVLILTASAQLYRYLHAIWLPY